MKSDLFILFFKTSSVFLLEKPKAKCVDLVSVLPPSRFLFRNKLFVEMDRVYA